MFIVFILLRVGMPFQKEENDVIEARVENFIDKLKKDTAKPNTNEF